MSYLPKEEKRKAILDATLRLAVAHGFAGITARKVAAEMGTATGTIHHHFSSLDNLKQEAVHYAVQSAHEYDLQAIEGLSPYDALCRLLLPSNIPDREFDTRIWLSAADEMWRNEGLKQEFCQGMTSYTDSIESLIEQGCSQGLFKPILPPRQCAWKLSGTAFSLSSYTYLDDPSLDLPAVDAIILKDLQVTLGIA
ncbi:TetR family transcriptional regulator [Parendozoicomonas haliclonae]|uniref:Transcriptional regulator BetI n=2 Tax=Parendozoicomonas haliclonae TaxID=1960125 RepID=A0A1X7ARX4_9GAMM|nr:transcriptional regulator BetI [Parendozoicomonas haliclonae]